MGKEHNDQIRANINTIQSQSSNNKNQISSDDIDPEKLLEEYLVRTESPTQT